MSVADELCGGGDADEYVEKAYLGGEGADSRLGERREGDDSRLG